MLLCIYPNLDDQHTGNRQNHCFNLSPPQAVVEKPRPPGPPPRGSTDNHSADDAADHLHAREQKEAEREKTLRHRGLCSFLWSIVGDPALDCLRVQAPTFESVTLRAGKFYRDRCIIPMPGFSQAQKTKRRPAMKKNFSVSSPRAFAMFSVSPRRNRERKPK